MRFSTFTILLLSVSASAATAASENKRSHQNLRRRHLLNEQQVSLKVNLAASCQITTEATMFLTFPLVFP
jgi:hypothetical protein